MISSLHNFCKDRKASLECPPHDFQISKSCPSQALWRRFPQPFNQRKPCVSQNFHSMLLTRLLGISFIVHCCFHHSLLHVIADFSVMFSLYIPPRVLGVMSVNWQVVNYLCREQMSRSITTHSLTTFFSLSA